MWVLLISDLFWTYWRLSLLSVSFSGIDKALSRRVTYEASVCSLILDVHVKQYDMCMWDSTTCASHAALHVHLKQDYPPRLPTLLYGIELYQYRRKRLMAMTNAIKLKTVQIWTHHRVTQSFTEYYLSDQLLILMSNSSLKISFHTLFFLSIPAFLFSL